MNEIKKFLKRFIPTPAKKSEDLYKLTINDIVDIQSRLMPKAMLDYEVQLVEHCNLNCKSCSHFCPVAKEEFLDINEYKRDCERLSKLFNKEASFIRLMGGEPLLHPKIVDFLNITRANFPNALIDLDTNGTLILKMKDDFWKAMHKNNINLTVTKYPIELDLKKIQEKCDKEKVTFRFFSEQSVKYFNHLPLDLEGRQPIEYNFMKCYLANSCHTLKHGRLYTCSTVPHVEHFNQYFQCNLQLSKDDSIDIYGVKDKKEILEFLAKPIPFCRYCKVRERKQQLWEVSKKDIKEWV